MRVQVNLGYIPEFESAHYAGLNKREWKAPIDLFATRVHSIWISKKEHLLSVDQGFLTQMCARFSPRRSAAPWEEAADVLVPANQR